MLFGLSKLSIAIIQLLENLKLELNLLQLLYVSLSKWLTVSSSQRNTNLEHHTHDYEPPLIPGIFFRIFRNKDLNGGTRLYAELKMYKRGFSPLFHGDGGE